MLVDYNVLLLLHFLIEYKQDLEKHIHSETSGHFRRLLISLTAVRPFDRFAKYRTH